jgi:hypothetical protein
MKLLTQPNTRSHAVAGSALQASALNVAGRSSQVSDTVTWTGVAGVSAAAMLVVAPSLAVWLCLPVIPAILLRCAGRDRAGNGRRDRAVMRIFSIATFVATVSQLVTTVSSLQPAFVVASAVSLFLVSVEQLAVPRRR